MKVGELAARVIAIAGTAFASIGVLPGEVMLHVQQHADVLKVARRLADELGATVIFDHEVTDRFGSAHKWTDCAMRVGDTTVMIMSRHEHVAKAASA